MRPVRIRVLKTEFYPDLADAYLTDGAQAGPCPLHAPGDEYLYTGGAEKPEGLCPWAWLDLYRGVSALSLGATCTPWNRRDGQSIACCTDGVRPVIFALTAQDQAAE